MTLKDIIVGFTETTGFWVIIGLTLVQIAPIKINPWSFILEWVGKKLTSDLSKKIDKIENKQENICTTISNMQLEVKTVKKEFELKNANDWRWDILDFFNSARNGRPHSKEEWDHAVDQVKKYERYVEIHGIDNGVLEEASRWLRCEYQKHIDANDFLS